jgi:lysozyme
MKASERLISKVKSIEKLRLDAYLDLKGGVWTIGWGHTGNVKKGDRITSEKADELLASDIAVAEKAVNSLGLKLNQNQFDALTDFVYNVGEGSLKKSTLLKRIREGADILVI